MAGGFICFCIPQPDDRVGSISLSYVYSSQ